MVIVVRTLQVMTVLMTIYVIVRIKIVTGVNIRNRQGAGFGSWTWRLERKTGQTSKAPGNDSERGRGTF